MRETDAREVERDRGETCGKRGKSAVLTSAMIPFFC